MNEAIKELQEAIQELKKVIMKELRIIELVEWINKNNKKHYMEELRDYDNRNS